MEEPIGCIVVHALGLGNRALRADGKMVSNFKFTYPSNYAETYVLAAGGCAITFARARKFIHH